MFKRILRNSENSALLALLLLIGGLAGAKDVLNLVVPGEIGLYLILIFFAWFAYSSLQDSRRIAELAPLPIEPRYFNPFSISEDQPVDAIWPRKAEGNKVADKIRQTSLSHLIVSGPSGAGKSTLMKGIVAPIISGEFEVYSFNEYENITVSVLQSLGGYDLVRQGQLSRRISKFLAENTCTVREVLESEPESLNPTAKALWIEVEDYLQDALQGTPKCFVFDQIERYLHVIKIESERVVIGTNGYELFFFTRLMKSFRTNENCRSVLVIKADNLYESVDFLESAVSGAIGKDGKLEYFLCPGVHESSAPDGVMKIRENFQALHLPPGFSQTFEGMCGLDSRSYSNTFLTQMLGYILEHFYRNDKRVEAMIRFGRDRTLSIRYYFDHFLNDFAREASSPDALDIIRVVLFAVATENKATGMPVEPRKVAALVHMPVETIQEALEFSRKAGVLIEEGKNHSIAFRFIHDIMSDHVLESDQFNVASSLQECIRGLSEAHVKIDDMRKVDSHADLIRDLKYSFNLGLAAIWVFFIFGAPQTRFETVCQWAAPFLQNAPLWQQCPIVQKYYLPVYLMHVVWLIFIYHIHRDYLRYVLRSSFLRGCSAAMPVIGAGLAIYLSQSPALAIVPIAVVGFMMGTIMLLGVWLGSFVGSDARGMRSWGIRASANMIISSCLAGVSCLVLWQAPIAQQFWDRVAQLTIGPGADRDWISLIWMYSMSGLMIYFWFAVKPAQQSKIAYAGRLASYDRAWAEAQK